MGIIQDSVEVVKLAIKFANPELIERVTALNEQVLDISGKNIECQQKIARLEKELQEANDKLKLVGEVERKDGYVYLKTEGEPCCSRCFDVDRRLVHIIETRDTKVGVHPICPECETHFADLVTSSICRTLRFLSITSVLSVAGLQTIVSPVLSSQR